MVTPRWVRNRIQPIAIRDVLRYLVGCAELPPDVNRSFDIGGRDVLTYEQMMQRYAAVAGLRRRIIVPTPVLEPMAERTLGRCGDAGPGKHRQTAGQVPAQRGGVHRERHPALRGPAAGGAADVRAGGTAGTGARARRQRHHALVERLGPRAPAEPLPTDPDWAGGSLYVDDRSTTVDASPADLWQIIEGIGGENGWYSFPLAWEVRGWADRAVGGGRAPARAPRLRAGARRRDCRLLAGGGAPPGGDASAPSRDADARPCLAGAPRRSRRPRAHRLPPAGDLPPARAARARLLVVGGPFHGIVFGSMLRNIAKAAERVAIERQDGPA